MKLKSYGTVPDKDVGFVVIEDLGNAQQVCVDAQKLIIVLRIVQQLVKLGFGDVIITVETNHPLIIGRRQMGIGIAPRVMEE